MTNPELNRLKEQAKKVAGWRADHEDLPTILQSLVKAVQEECADHSLSQRKKRRLNVLVWLS